MYEDLNYEKLREDLIDYYGTAISLGMTTAIIQLNIVEKCSNDKLIEIALENSFDLNEYRNQKIIKFIWQ